MRYADIVIPNRFTKTVSRYADELNPLTAAISRWVSTEPLRSRFTFTSRTDSIESRTLHPVIWRNLLSRSRLDILSSEARISDVNPDIDRAAIISSAFLTNLPAGELGAVDMRRVHATAPPTVANLLRRRPASKDAIVRAAMYPSSSKSG